MERNLIYAIVFWLFVFVDTGEVFMDRHIFGLVGMIAIGLPVAWIFLSALREVLKRRRQQPIYEAKLLLQVFNGIVTWFPATDVLVTLEDYPLQSPFRVKIGYYWSSQTSFRTVTLEIDTAKGLTLNRLGENPCFFPFKRQGSGHQEFNTALRLALEQAGVPRG